MTRRRYLWNLVFVLGVPLLFLFGFPLVGGLIWPSCSEASGSPCVGFAFGYLYAVIFVVPIILIVGAFWVVWRRARVADVPRLLSVPAAIFAFSLASLPLLPGQMRSSAGLWSAAIQGLTAPLCLAAMLIVLAALPEQQRRPKPSAVGPVWLVVWLAAIGVAAFTRIPAIVPPLFYAQLTLLRLTGWPVILVGSGVVFVVGLLIILWDRTRALNQTGT